MTGLEFIHKGTASGSVASRMLKHGLDYGVLRPIFDPKTQLSYCSLHNQRDEKTGKPKNVLTSNATGLTKEAWQKLDTAILRAAQPQLTVWSDIVNAGLTYDVPNGMGVTVIQHQTMTHAGNATLSMSPLRKAERDRPEFDIVNLPLPIAHADFSFDLREIMVSRNSGAPLDTTMAEEETRKVTEIVETLTLGTLASYSYGGGTIYGLINHPNRIASNITSPATAGWTPATLVNELLGSLQSMRDLFFNGPYGVYFSPSWAQYLDQDYSDAYAGETTMTRLSKIQKIRFMKQADYLTGFQIVIFQLTPDVIQAVTGMRLTTVQWEEQGGFEVIFKIMCIMIPRVRASAAGTAGILHLTGV